MNTNQFYQTMKQHCKLNLVFVVVFLIFFGTYLQAQEVSLLLHVDTAGVLSSYKLAPVWGDFATIIEEDGTAVSQTSTRNATAYIEPKTIVVKGVNVVETVSVYSAFGALIKTVKATGGDLKINVLANQLYLVKTTEKTFKVAL